MTKYLLYFSIILINSLFNPCVYADLHPNERMAKDVYIFKTNEQKISFNSLLKDLRCLVCQNQDLSDSQAQFAKDLRQDIYQQIIQGQSKEKIITSLTSEYGDFILFQPPIKKTTYFLWMAPFILLFFGTIFLLLRLCRKKSPKTQ